MSEETDTMLEFKYEDEFSYVSGEGSLMLKETSYFDKRKLAVLDDDDSVKEVVEQYKEAFSVLEEKVEKLIDRSGKSTEAFEELESEIKEAEAIGDFESLLNRIREEKAGLKTETESGSEASETAAQADAGDAKAKKEESAGAETPQAESKTDTATATEPDPAGDASTATELNQENGDSPAETGDVTAEPGNGTAEQQAETDETEALQKEDDGEDDVEVKEEEEEGLTYYREITEKAEDLAKQSDWPYVSMELDKLASEWEEGPDAGEADDKLKALQERFQSAKTSFEERKEEHYRQLKKQKRENLQTKKKLLEQLEEIVSEEKWTAVKQVRRIRGQWKNIGILPSGEPEELDKRYDALNEEFEEHKVDRLVSQRQQEEDNLTGKLIVLDKMEDLAKSIDENVGDWKTVDKEFHRLTNQYKRIGKVPPEKSDEVWGRYKAAQEEYYDRKYKFDEKHRQQFDKNYQKKEDLCRKAEALLEEKDLASAARELNQLHRRWKKTGNLPQRDEDELWARFKAATDKFNERKSENIDRLREQEEANYQKKLELIERAKQENETTDWDKGHSIMQNLLDEWKKVGPVPRNKSRKLWKKFKKAQDVFYERRREHFQERKEEQKENLNQKQEILDKLKELGRHDDPIEAVEKAKPLQEEFKNAGYVPIKKKNKIWKEYREACDIIYDRFRAAKSGNKFDQELAKADIEPEQRAKIQDIRKKYKKVKREIRTLEEEVLQYKESKTYFKPSSSEGNPLIEEIQQKIDKAENRLQKKQDKLDELDREIEELRA